MNLRHEDELRRKCAFLRGKAEAMGEAVRFLESMGGHDIFESEFAAAADDYEQASDKLEIAANQAAMARGAK